MTGVVIELPNLRPYRSTRGPYRSWRSSHRVRMDRCTAYRRRHWRTTFRRLEGEAGETGSTLKLLNLLSLREREIVTLAASRRWNMEIARHLSITHKTVGKHLASACQKVHISWRAQLSAYVAARADAPSRAGSSSRAKLSDSATCHPEPVKGIHNVFVVKREHMQRRSIDYS